MIWMNEVCIVWCAANRVSNTNSGPGTVGSTTRSRKTLPTQTRWGKHTAPAKVSKEKSACGLSNWNRGEVSLANEKTTNTCSDSYFPGKKSWKWDAQSGKSIRYSDLKSHPLRFRRNIPLQILGGELWWWLEEFSASRSSAIPGYLGSLLAPAWFFPSTMSTLSCLHHDEGSPGFLLVPGLLSTSKLHMAVHGSA